MSDASIEPSGNSRVLSRNALSLAPRSRTVHRSAHRRLCRIVHGRVQVAPDVRGEYEFGALQVFVDADFMRTYEAAKRGMKEVGLFQTGDDRLSIEAELNGRDSVDTRVIVKVKEIGKNRTSVKIRYGVVKPDLPSAQKLFQAIQKHL
jgi:hypothetical protein